MHSRGVTAICIRQVAIKTVIMVARGGGTTTGLMRPNPQLSFKTWGGGGLEGGGVQQEVGEGGVFFPRGRGGSGRGSGWGSWGRPARGEGEGGVRVRVQVTELVEPVLVL